MADIILSAENSLGVSGPKENISWTLFCDWCRTTYEPLIDPIEEISYSTLNFLGSISEIDDTIDDLNVTEANIPRDTLIEQAGQVIARASRLLDAWNINPLEDSESLELILWNSSSEPLFQEIINVAKSDNEPRKVDMIRHTGLTMTTCAVRTASSLQTLKYEIQDIEDEQLINKIDIKEQIQSVLCTIMALSTIIRLVGSSMEEVLTKHVIKEELENNK